MLLTAIAEDSCWKFEYVYHKFVYTFVIGLNIIIINVSLKFLK